MVSLMTHKNPHEDLHDRFLVGEVFVGEIGMLMKGSRVTAKAGPGPSQRTCSCCKTIIEGKVCANVYT